MTNQPDLAALADRLKRIRELIVELPLEAQPIGYSINRELDELAARLPDTDKNGGDK